MSRNLITVIESGLACYRLEPRGASGLEGYSLDQVYRFERCEDGKGRYCRVYPDGSFPATTKLAASASLPSISSRSKSGKP